ncbi:MAG: response regulator transcription factor [Gaiellaceae bacterium]
MNARVLVCDDVKGMRDLLALAVALTPELELVGEARNGREAVEQAAAQQPDVVLLDLAMPMMDGLEALPEIRGVAPGAKVIVLSGFDADLVAEEALALGAERYLEKGLDPLEIARIAGEVATTPG